MSVHEIIEAIRIASEVHAKGRRKGSGDPYINHPIRVAELLALDRATPTEISAGALHDVLEESDLSEDWLRSIVDLDVAQLVIEVTDPVEIRDLPRLERKQAQAAQYKTARHETRRIKLADAIANLEDLIKTSASWSPDNALNYVEGAEILIEACKEASGMLGALAMNKCIDARRHFENIGRHADVIHSC
jgi:guanosine-3',5'-bis(diphosphate) 3'-pyrophosphohydrolase